MEQLKTPELPAHRPERVVELLREVGERYLDGDIDLVKIAAEVRALIHEQDRHLSKEDMHALDAQYRQEQAEIDRGG